MKNLYPLKFHPIIKDKIWGGNKLNKNLEKMTSTEKAGESWEISGVQGDISIVANGYLKGNNLQEIIEIYMADLVGEKIFKQYGIEFPLLIKFIDANDKLSIQVHPDDKLAKGRHNSYGKTEMWYVLQAEKNSELVVGFNQKIDKAGYLKNIENNTVEKILNIVKVNPGNVFFLPAGRIHAIGAGLLLAEIQQTSDITYRIYDYMRKDEKGNYRELHTDLAIDAINFNDLDNFQVKYAPEINNTVQLVECDYFTTNLLEFDKTIEKDYFTVDSFVIYMCFNGKFSIEYSECNTIEVNTGDTILLPAELKNVKLIPFLNTKILEVYI